MNLRKLGSSTLNVSELCLGTMQFGWTADEAASFAMMDAFVAAGGNFIDTADIYTNWGPDGMAGGGRSEEIIGRWLKARGNRDQMVIATKVRGKMAEGPDGEGLKRTRVVRCCEDSLRRLQADCIDLYQLHWADLNTPIEETLGARCAGARRQGARHRSFQLSGVAADGGDLARRPAWLSETGELPAGVFVDRAGAV